MSAAIRNIRYTIQLMSNIRDQAAKDSAAVEHSNAAMSAAYDKTSRDSARSVKQLTKTLKQMEASVRDTGRSLEGLAATGNGVGARMARHFDALRFKLQKVKIDTESTTNALKKMGAVSIKGGAMATGAVVGGGVAAKNMLEKPVDYEERISRIAITADNGKTVDSFKNVKAEIEQGIIAANKSGGGKRDDAANALDNMTASGMALKAAVDALPSVMETATASGADAKELTDILIKGRQNGYIKNGEEGKFLEHAVAAGKAGQFELKDMAKWLGQQMGAGTMAGLSGEKGFDRLLMMNQMAMMTAGSKDEAGNNVVNLLGKLNSKDTAKDFKSETGKDLTPYLMAERKKGGDTVDAWLAILRDSLKNNKEYQQAEKSLKNAKSDDEKRQIYQSVASLAMGNEVGKFFQDRQALSALIPLVLDKGGKDSPSTQVGDAIKNSFGVVKQDKAKFDTTTTAKLNAAENAKDNATSSVFDGVKPAVDGMISGFTELTAAYPKSTVALTALTGAVILAATTLGGGSAMGAAYDFLKNKKNKKKRGSDALGDAADEFGSPKHHGGGVVDVFVTNANELGGDSSGSDKNKDRNKSKSKGRDNAKPRENPNKPTTKTNAPNKGTPTKTAPKVDLPKPTANSPSRLSKVGRYAGRMGGLLAAGAAIYEGYEVLTDASKSSGQKAQGVSAAAGGAAGGAIGGWAGAAGGAAIGAAVGSIVPVIGTAIGAAIGGIVGGLGGGYLGYKGGRAGGDMLGGYARDHIDGVVAPSTSASRLNGYMSASPLLAGFTPMAMQGAVSAGMAQGMSGFGTSMGSNLAAAFASTQAASPSTMPAYLTSPALAPPAPPQKVDISIANGKLDVAVTVTANASSELLNVVATAKQPPAFPLQLSAVGGGSTNPAGYGSGSGSSSGSVKRFNF